MICRRSLVCGFCLYGLLGTIPLMADDSIRSTESTTMRLFVPAYFYPSGEGLTSWNRLIESQSTDQKIEILVIANINSGNVGTTLDPNYADVIRRSVKNGLKVIGYITSDYANRHGVSPLATAKTNVSDWFRLYPELHGIFVDEQTSDSSEIDAYYLPLRRHINSLKPKAIVVGNPGNNCSENFLVKRPDGPIMDIVVIHENNELKVPYAKATPENWMAAYSSERFAMLAHTSPTFEPQLKLARQNRTGYVFVTDAIGPPPDTIHPWGQLPSYWSEERKLIGELNRLASKPR